MDVIDRATSTSCKSGALERGSKFAPERVAASDSSPPCICRTAATPERSVLAAVAKRDEEPKREEIPDNISISLAPEPLCIMLTNPGSTAPSPISRSSSSDRLCSSESVAATAPRFAGRLDSSAGVCDILKGTSLRSGTGWASGGGMDALSSWMTSEG